MNGEVYGEPEAEGLITDRERIRTPTPRAIESPYPQASDKLQAESEKEWIKNFFNRPAPEKFTMPPEVEAQVKAIREEFPPIRQRGQAQGKIDVPWEIYRYAQSLVDQGDVKGAKDLVNKYILKQAEAGLKPKADAYKIGHIQEFKQSDGTTIYKEYKGNNVWQDRPELGGGISKSKGFDTMEEAVTEAKRVHKATGSGAALIPSAELGAGNKWIPKLVPNVEARATATMGPGFGSLPEESKEVFYETYLKDKTLPPFAYRDGKGRDAFMSGFAKWVKDNNIEGGDIVIARAKQTALRLSLNKQQTVRGMMGSFANNIDKQVDRVNEIMGDMVKRFGTRALNIPYREWVTRFAGSGYENILTAYTFEISNEIGKLSTGSAQSIAELSVAAQERWAKVHDPNLPLSELKKVLDETKHMTKMRLDSADNEIKRVLKEMKAPVVGEKSDKPKKTMTLKSGKVIEVED